MTPLPRPCLCLVTNRRAIHPSARTPAAESVAFEAWLDEAIEAGVDLIQVREPDLPARRVLALVERLKRRCEGLRTTIVVNDRADIAAAAGAGLHLKSDGPLPALVRALLGSALVGKSVHAISEIAESAGADYLTFGTVFPSHSKDERAPVAGPAGLAQLVQATDIPVLAIGGITPDRVAACRDAGARGLAAIGVFLPPGCAPGALGPHAAVAALRTAWNNHG